MFSLFIQLNPLMNLTFLLIETDIFIGIVFYWKKESLGCNDNVDGISYSPFIILYSGFRWLD